MTTKRNRPEWVQKKLNTIRDFPATQLFIEQEDVDILEYICGLEQELDAAIEESRLEGAKAMQEACANASRGYWRVDANEHHAKDAILTLDPQQVINESMEK